MWPTTIAGMWPTTVAGMWPTTVAGMWPTTVAGGHLIARPGLRDVNVHMRTRRESFG
jgi:hypothetical protein